MTRHAMAVLGLAVACATGFYVRQETSVLSPCVESGVPALPPFDEFVKTPVPVDVASGRLVPGRTPVWEADQAIVFERIIKGRPPFHEAVLVPGSPRGL